MNSPNIYTYRQSELPELTDETKAEIAAIDALVAGLILKIQGNPKALNNLYEILQDCLSSCDLNLTCIQIVPDDYRQPENSKITLTDLPIDQKRIVFDTAFTNTVMLKVISGLTDEEIGLVGLKIANTVECELSRFQVSDEKVEKAIANLVEAADPLKNESKIIIVPVD